MIDESTVNQHMVPEISLLIKDGYASHYSAEVFPILGDHNIVVVCLPPDADQFLQPLDVGTSELIVIAYYVELNEWQQAGNTNINRVNFLALFKSTREKAKRAINIETYFEGTQIPLMNAGFTTMSVSFSEKVVFMSPV